MPGPLAQLVRLLGPPRLWIALLMGFASGLPLLALGSTLQAWLVESGVDLGAVGALSLVGLPYTWKFLWSPTLDRYAPPLLGRRRGWLAGAQLLLAGTLASLALLDPARTPWLMGAVALCAALLAATQDIAVDAYRRESLREEELGLGSSLYVIGYRGGMLLSGAGALALAETLPWRTVYLIVGAVAAGNLVVTLLAREPEVRAEAPRTLRDAVVEPFLEFFRRNGVRQALLLLSFILLFKVGDAMAANMTTPFILKLGYSKATLAAIVKVFGLVSLLAGGFAGGLVLLRWGMRRSLLAFGLLQAASTAAFALLPSFAGAEPGPARMALAGVVAFENVTAGMGSSAFVGFMASLTNKRFTATQYALLTSLMAVPRVILSAPTGWMAQTMGWVPFFLLCAAIAIPGLLLVPIVARTPAPAEGPGAAPAA